MPVDTPISVFVRCRPLNRREIETDSGLGVKMQGNRVIVSDPNRERTLDRRFTECFWSVDGGDGQDVVHAKVGAPLVAQALKGFDTTLIAYGQTGTGKTFSMMGYKTERG